MDGILKIVGRYMDLFTEKGYDEETLDKAGKPGNIRAILEKAFTEAMERSKHRGAANTIHLTMDSYLGEKQENVTFLFFFQCDAALGTIDLEMFSAGCEHGVFMQQIREDGDLTTLKRVIDLLWSRQMKNITKGTKVGKRGKTKQI